jgi:hypothetical protein
MARALTRFPWAFNTSEIVNDKLPGINTFARSTPHQNIILVDTSQTAVRRRPVIGQHTYQLTDLGILQHRLRHKMCAHLHDRMVSKHLTAFSSACRHSLQEHPWIDCGRMFLSHYGSAARMESPQLRGGATLKPVEQWLLTAIEHAADLEEVEPNMQEFVANTAVRLCLVQIRITKVCIIYCTGTVQRWHLP